MFQTQQWSRHVFGGALECDDGLVLALARQDNPIARFGSVKVVQQLSRIGVAELCPSCARRETRRTNFSRRDTLSVSTVGRYKSLTRCDFSPA